MAHHPEKFLDGRMLWRGRIYSPLPFVRSLSGTKINAGVWGTAAFPSVYRTDVHPFAFLPHSIRWQVVVVRPDAGRSRRRRCSGGHDWAAALLLGTGIGRHRGHDRQERRLRHPIAGGLAARAASCGTGRRSRISTSFSRSRGCRGRIRGVLSPPEIALPHAGRAGPAVDRGRRCARPGARSCCCPERVTEDRFWSEHVDVRRARAVAARRLAAPIARGSDDRDRRWLVGRSRPQHSRRPLGMARRPRARRGSRRRQVDAARQHAPASDDARRRRRARARARALRRGRVRRRAPLAAGGRDHRRA